MRKIIILFGICTFISLILVNMTTKVYSGEEMTFSLLINEEGQEIYSEMEEQIKYKYDVLFLPLDAIFSKIFKDYDSISQEQTIIYNKATLEIDKSNKLIKINNVSFLDTSKINNSIEIEIEEMEGKMYVPIYLISNLPGVEVEIDNKKIYNKYKYYNSIDALDSSKIKHNIIIKLNQTEEFENQLDNQYAGEDDGALWREEAYKRIEKYRMERINAIVKNQNGKTLKDADVNLKMVNNEFKFGTAVRMVNATKENKYTNITLDLFNAIGSENGFKWSVLSKNGSHTVRDIIEYAKNNNMYLRGHCLWWGFAEGELQNLIGNIDNTKEGTMAYIYKQYHNGNFNEKEVDTEIEKLKVNFENIVLNHIKEEVTEFFNVQEWDVVNEPVTEQYFKYYIYDKALLTDAKFLSSVSKELSRYKNNEEYNKFLARCFETAKNANPKAKLLLSDDRINGNFDNLSLEDTIEIVKNIKKYTNSIDALGVHYHVNNNYLATPQSYYNQINYVLEQTGLKEAVVTEYDNYAKDKLNKYTKEEREKKANYLRDTLIAQYSNPKVSGFNFWVYNSGTGSFVEEEWQAYEELMKEWLNDEQNGKTDSNGNYSTRLYKGEYTAKVKINDLEKEVPIRVADNTEPIEIIINSNLEKISIKQKPNKTEYIQDKESFDVNGGVILAHYDDGTVEEINMSSGEVEISKLDNSILGKQTITVTYKDKKVTFVVDVIEQSGKSPVVGANEEITDISIVKLPERVEYIQNKEKINLKAGKLLIKYKDGTTKEISMDDKDVSISGFDNSILGEKAIRVTYKGKETTFVVSIVEDTSKSDDTIANKNLPNAGMQITILTVIIILVIIAIVSGKKYIQYLKDTYKQIK